MDKNKSELNKRNITMEDFNILKVALRDTLASLEEFGPSILPHLTDTDENAGEQLRYFMHKCGIGNMDDIENSVYNEREWADEE